jgi:N-acetylneuraminic acid mutarotase
MTHRSVAAAGAAVAVLLLAAPVLAAGGGTWQAAGETVTEPSGHTATLLYDGTVLVVGGLSGDNQTAAAELYDPATNRWTAVAAPAVARTGHAAVRLDDGRVLVVGGDEVTPNALELPVASAEIYDPRSGRWSAAAPMSTPRLEPTLTLLANGYVVVAGGATGGDAVTASAEVYDPAADRWRAAAPMSTPRTEASALLLRTGRVLVAGGADRAANQDGSLASAELYDAGRDAWTPAAAMPTRHAGADAGLLADGRALVAGGFDYQGGFGLAVADADLYDPGANSWHATGPLLVARGSAGGAMLADGRFLVVGGVSRTSSRAESSAELFDPATGTWSQLPRLPENRIGATVTALRGGGALVVGGARRPVAELFVPDATPKPTAATLLGAVGQDLPLVALTLLLLVAAGAQQLWRRARAG